MRNRLAGPGWLLVLALAAACTPAESPDPLDSLIARHIEARGGAERLAAIETVRMSGRAIAGPGREAQVTREVYVPDRIRTEFKHQGVTSVFACDRSDCWYVAPMSGIFEAESMTESDASLALDQADILGPLYEWRAKGHTVELLGKERIEGREVFKLQVTLRGGGSHTDFLDAESALLVRRKSSRTLGERTIELESTFSDFRTIDGVTFPHSIVNRNEAGIGTLQIVVERAEVNVVLDDARFERPE